MITIGDGITSCLQLRSTARAISEEIQCHPKKPWPPTPQDLIESNESVNKRLFITIASSGLGGMGTIKKYLSGGVKEGIILHKKLFEALMRTKIEYIEKTRISDVLNDEHINSLIDIMIEKITGDTVESVLRSINMEYIPVLNGDNGKPSTMFSTG